MKSTFPMNTAPPPHRARSWTLVLVACALATWAISSRGDSWSAPKKETYASDNKQYVFAVKPAWRWDRTPGRCVGTLYRTTGGSRTRVWSRYLINNVAPSRAFVANSGSYVVTMDEYARLGQLPIVIYSNTGHLIAAHSLESMQLTFDNGKYRHTVSSAWWSENAELIWGPRDESIIIKLSWGKILVMDTPTGALKGMYPLMNTRMIDAFSEFQRKYVAQYAHDLFQTGSSRYREIAEALTNQYHLRLPP